MRRFGLRGGAAAAIGLVVAAACSARPLADKPSCKNGGSCPPGWNCGPDSECVFVGSGGFAAVGGGSFGGSAGITSGGFGGAGAVGGVSGTGGIQNVTLGGACEFDWECSASGLGCMRADSGLLDAASPAKGMCTISCAAGASVCAAIAPDAHCMKLPSGVAYCVEGCAFGPLGLSAFSDAKCHGRKEMACSPIGAQSGKGACLPRCNLDEDCEPGWFCDPRDGLCRQDPPVGLAVGALCTPAGDGGTDPCLGTCSGQVAAADGGSPLSVCAQGCTWGVYMSCGWTDTTQPAPGFCLVGADGIELGFGPGAGDLGQCAALCDCDAQCSGPLVCLPFGDPQLAAVTQRKGFCGSGGASIGACN